MRTEDDFRKDMTNIFDRDGVWWSRIEPARGMKPGIPDLTALLCNYPFFIELKVGEFKNGLLYPRKVRPAQIGWHRSFNDAGGKSFVCVGVENGDSWNAFFLKPEDVSGYEVGIPASKCFLVKIIGDGLVFSLDKSLNNLLHF